MSVVHQTLIRTSKVKGHARNLEKQEWQASPTAQVWHWTKWCWWNRYRVNQNVNSWFIFSFTDTNPLQLSYQVVYLPHDIKSETLVTNVTVTGRLESLVQPLLFYVEDVTQQQQLPRSESKRKRRDIDDFCEGAGTVKPMSYFCNHRLTGVIEVTDDFQFKNGDEFDAKIRVTDSDQWGKTENTAKIKFIWRDLCRNLRAIYDVAVKNCINNSSSVTVSDFVLTNNAHLQNCFVVVFTCLLWRVDFIWIQEHTHFDAFPQIIHEKAPEITSGNNSMWRFLRHGFVKAAVSFIRRKRESGVFEIK